MTKDRTKLHFSILECIPKEEGGCLGKVEKNAAERNITIYLSCLSICGQSTTSLHPTRERLKKEENLHNYLQRYILLKENTEDKSKQKCAKYESTR